MIEKKETSLKASTYAACALAFASLGDAFLYPYLPVNFSEVGVPVTWVGLLLSINRFVRILSNSAIVHVFARYGLRTVMVVAVVLSITSTFGYGMATGTMMWLLFRIMWGVAFSALRIGTLDYALKNQREGLAIGLSRSVQELGPVVSLLLAPVLMKHLQPGVIFYMLALFSLPALYFALDLPSRPDKTQSIQAKLLLQWPSSLNVITFVSAIVIDGIVVIVLGVLFLQYRNDVTLVTATTLAALYLGYRRICLVVLSPAGGWIADKIGLSQVFNYSLIFVILGLILMTSGWVGVGAVVVFTFYSIHSAITPGSASKTSSHSLAAVAENATWRDIGAAVGTLSGGFLISSSHLTNVLYGGIVAMSIFLIVHLRSAPLIFKRVLLWK